MNFDFETVCMKIAYFVLCIALFVPVLMCGIFFSYLFSEEWRTVFWIVYVIIYLAIVKTGYVLIFGDKYERYVDKASESEYRARLRAAYYDAKIKNKQRHDAIKSMRKADRIRKWNELKKKLQLKKKVIKNLEEEKMIVKCSKCSCNIRLPKMERKTIEVHCPKCDNKFVISV